MKRPSQSAEPIVVTGMGCVSPLGHGVDACWNAALAGRSGIVPITGFDTDGFATRIAGEVQGEPDVGAVSPKELRRMDRGVIFALAAAREALETAHLEIGDHNRHRVGVAVGSGISGLGTILANHKTILEKGPRRASPFTIPMGIANMPSGCVSIQYGLGGPNLCFVSACASGAHSIGECARLIARGDADVMVAGGTEAPIYDLSVAGFGAMRALSTRNDEPERASRPFDRDRDGFVMGEGSAILVLESLAHARARGAEPLAEVRGYAATADATHMAAPDETGSGVARCMSLALADAEVNPGDLGYVNAHATSTPVGDRVEVAAVRKVLGDAADRVPVSATKSMTGHLLGAAGAVEAVFSIQALRTGQLPPTINLEHPDPDCALDHVTGGAREAKVSAVMSNSFGFGGTNAVLVFGPHP